MRRLDLGRLGRPAAVRRRSRAPPAVTSGDRQSRIRSGR
jgi:hypothetical protein